MRKTALLSVVLVSIMLVVPCHAYSAPPVTNGLVGCWNFEEGTGNTAIDTSGNGNNGTIVNATYSTDTPPRSLSNYSLRFNNTYWGDAYSYVTIPDSPSLRPSSGLTLALWVKADTVDGRHIISKPHGSSGGDSFVIWCEGGGMSFSLSMLYALIPTAKPPANEWHHIAATYDGSYMRIYVDGVEKVNNTVPAGPISYDDNPVLIGADINHNDSVPDEGWYGLIDEVLIYNRALNPAEIMQIIHPATALYGIIGNYLVTIDQTTGDAAEVGLINATINTNVFLGLTYDPYADALYAVANATTDPTLIVIDRTTVQATVVGPIDLKGYDPTYMSFVESLAFNSDDSTLYGSAGTAAPYSNMLISIDPATGNATLIASITGTTENDGDTLVFINGTLYLSDSSPDGVLYTVSLSNGTAVYVGNIGFSNIILAYNPETQTLFGTVAYGRLLIEISTSTGQGTLVGPTHTPEEFEGGYMSAAAFVHDGSPPDINVPTQDPTADNVQPYQNVTILVNVTDTMSGVKSVTLVYSLDNATTWEEPLAMNLNATTGSYEAVIPGQPTGTWVKYKIVAFDYMGNNATLEGEQSYLAYQVVPEFRTFLILPLFMVTSLLAVILYKRKRPESFEG